MFTNFLRWTETIAEKEFHLLLDHDSPLESVKEMAYRILKHCGNVEDQIKAQQEQAKLESEQKENEQSEENKIEEISVEHQAEA